MDHEVLWAMVKRHEGLRLKPYSCSRNHTTIGYGWNIDAHALPDDFAHYLRGNGQITLEMAERLLNISLAGAEADCREIYPCFDSYTDNRRMALIDFVFNVGAAGAMKFRLMLKAIKAGDWNRAADEMYFSQWQKQLPNRADEIIGMVRTG
jgi:lysozyme